MSNQTFVEPKSFMRVCDIPDASLFTTLFVLFGKHFFVGLVNRIGAMVHSITRSFAKSPCSKVNIWSNYWGRLAIIVNKYCLMDPFYVTIEKNFITVGRI